MIAQVAQPSSSAQVAPTAAQLTQVKQAIAQHIQRIDQHPERRVGAYPYYLFHEPGQPIHGTILMFHGFSARPHQMWRLADYLFTNGFNVYQVNLAGQMLVNPAQNWPQVDLKPEYALPLKQKVAADPVLSSFIQNYRAQGQTMQQPGRLQQAALMARLIALEPRLLDMKKAIERSDDPDFDRYFTSSHMNYLTDAGDRLQELAAMPGNVYTVGLSVGGAVALGLAAAHPDRVKGVVAYAPLLEIYGAERRQYVELAGPLDIAEMGWDPTLQFPVGCLTAADRFGGSYVRRPEAIAVLKQVPTLMVLTDNEDAADIDTNLDFFEAIGGKPQGHRLFRYPAQDMVPHPMVDPEEVSQGMTNRFWQSMYQETLRFLTTGDIKPANFNSFSQDATLPTVNQ
jgi:alpha-beta hydrolase superfamily lysophospholipase